MADKNTHLKGYSVIMTHLIYLQMLRPKCEVVNMSHAHEIPFEGKRMEFGISFVRLPMLVTKVNRYITLCKAIKVQRHGKKQ